MIKNEISHSFKNKKIFITGHTGFKGSWMSLVLKEFGAKIFGFSLPSPTNPSMYKTLGLKKILDKNIIGDVNNIKKLKTAIKSIKPDFLIHMAAQPIVRQSYDFPIETYYSNTIGTLNILECIKDSKSIKASLIVTTDKVYDNKEKKRKFVETDRLGGKDPYSNSKACAELIIHSYINSYFLSKKKKVVSVRAGNIIGGGDFAEDRIIPDIYRALFRKKKILIRNPSSIRPWQHVLDAIFGYLVLLSKMSKNINYNNFPKSWNFGPLNNEKITVKIIFEMINRLNSNKMKYLKSENSTNKKESQFLMLNSNLAKNELNWIPKLDAKESINLTDAWFKKFFLEKKRIKDFTLKQVREYIKLLD
jgi:CDP-glucose 4,6-dehydratase